MADMPYPNAMPKWRAEVLNQYKRPIGDAIAATREEAIRLANERADEALKYTNARWKWRKAQTKVKEWTA